jgi:hypothetical protein
LFIPGNQGLQPAKGDESRRNFSFKDAAEANRILQMGDDVMRAAQIQYGT